MQSPVQRISSKRDFFFITLEGLMSGIKKVKKERVQLFSIHAFLSGLVNHLAKLAFNRKSGDFPLCLVWVRLNALFNVYSMAPLCEI